MIFLGRSAWSLDLLGVDQVGCNLDPEIVMPALERADHSIKVLIAGGGPAGMSAALCMSKHGYQVTFVEKTDHRGGQIALSWQAPGNGAMKGLSRVHRRCNGGRGIGNSKQGRGRRSSEGGSARSSGLGIRGLATSADSMLAGFVCLCRNQLNCPQRDSTALYEELNQKITDC